MCVEHLEHSFLNHLVNPSQVGATKGVQRYLTCHQVLLALLPLVSGVMKATPKEKATGIQEPC